MAVASLALGFAMSCSTSLSPNRTSGKVGGRWPLVTDNIPEPDTTKLIARPGTIIVYYRVDATLMFNAGISDEAKAAFFKELRIRPLGVTSDGVFFVKLPDPGRSITSFDDYYAMLNARPEVLGAIASQRSGDGKVVDGRAKTPFQVE